MNKRKTILLLGTAVNLAFVALLVGLILTPETPDEPSPIPDEVDDFELDVPVPDGLPEEAVLQPTSYDPGSIALSTRVTVAVHNSTGG